MGPVWQQGSKGGQSIAFFFFQENIPCLITIPLGFLCTLVMHGMFSSGFWHIAVLGGIAFDGVH